MNVIGTALLSFGMSGRVFHAPFLDIHPGYRLLGAWERSKKLIEQSYPNARSYESLEAVLIDEDVDLVVVNTPNSTHFEFARKALLAGKDIIVEKPFTVNAKEAAELCELEKATGRIISVYHNRRWDSDFKTVRSVFQSGSLGEVVEAEFHFDRFSSSLSAKLHKEVPGPGTGVLHDLGSHLIDAALVLFGRPGSVIADLDVVRPNSRVEDYMNLLLFYPHLRVLLRSSYMVRKPIPGFILHGREGSFLKSRSDVQEAALQNGASPALADWGIEPESERGILKTESEQLVETERGSYLRYFDLLYDALTNRSKAPVTANEGLQVMEVIDAAIKSNEEGRKINL